MYCARKPEVPADAVSSPVSGLRQLVRAGGDERGSRHERLQRAVVHLLPPLRNPHQSALRRSGLEAEPARGELLPDLERAMPNRVRMDIVDRPEHSAVVAYFS